MFEKTLLGFLSTTQKMDKEKIRSLIYNEEGELKEDALTTLLELDRKRVDKIKDGSKSDKDEIYGRATREVRTKTEKEIKSFFGVDSDKQGEELLEVVREKLAKSEGNEITDDKIKQSKVYQDLLKSKKTELEAVETEWKSKLEKAEKSFNQKSVFSTVNNRGIAIARSLNPILSKDPKRAQRQLSMISNELKGYEYEVDGKDIIVKKEGKIIEDGHGNQKQFEEVVRDITTGLFDINEGGSGGSGTGNNNDDPDDGGRKSVKKVKTQQELRELLETAKDQKQRDKIIADYKREKAEAEKNAKS